MRQKIGEVYLNHERNSSCRYQISGNKPLNMCQGIHIAHTHVFSVFDHALSFMNPKKSCSSLACLSYPGRVISVHTII